LYHHPINLDLVSSSQSFRWQGSSADGHQYISMGVRHVSPPGTPVFQSAPSVKLRSLLQCSVHLHGKHQKGLSAYLLGFLLEYVSTFTYAVKQSGWYHSLWLPSAESQWLQARTSLQRAVPELYVATQLHSTPGPHTWPTSYILHASRCVLNHWLPSGITHFWLVSYLLAKRALMSQHVPKLCLKFEQHLFILMFPRVSGLIKEFTEGV